MPELPEVETVRRQLAKEIIGKTIAKVTCYREKVLKPTPEVFSEAVTQSSVTSVERRAKLLVLTLDSGHFISIHLRMNGRVLLRDSSDALDPYLHVIIDFTDGTQLRFADSRVFGYLELHPATFSLQDITGRFGPEPLDDLVLPQFQQILSSTSRKIKDVLMDQSLVSGIGNIYANDALWEAKVHPESASNSIPSDRVEVLFHAIEQVLLDGIDAGGASDHWFVDAYGKKGRYQELFRVYGKKGIPCPCHPNTLIEYLKVSQRGTFVCSECQKRY